jgi:flavin-dependent trigonelline monooxygenase, reductase component
MQTRTTTVIHGPALDVKALRRALGTFVTGVTIVTTLDPAGTPKGITANSFTSVSLDPPLVLVCIGQGSSAFEAFRSCSSFAINILAEGQEALSSRFATKGADKFAGLDCLRGVTDMPIFPGCAGWLECRTYSAMPAGDHVLLVGQVCGFDAGASRPLGYWRGGYVSFGLEQAVLGRAGRVVHAGAIAEHDGRILLLSKSDASGRESWSIPCGELSGDDPTERAIERAVSAELGAGIEVSFLYSVFDLPEHSALCVVYRAQLIERPPQEAKGRLFAPEEIPWHAIADRQIRNMLRRYVAERMTDRFGIYMGSADGGRVAMINAPPESWQSHTSAIEGMELSGLLARRSNG